MTTDSVPLPPWSEVLDEAERRREEQRKELSRINWLRGAGAATMGLGILGGALLFVAWIANPGAYQLRHAVNPYATILTIGGLIVLCVGVVRAAGRRDRETITTAGHRDREAIMARFAKLERRLTAAEDSRLGWPRPSAGERVADMARDDAFVDALSEQEDQLKMGRRVMRVVRPSAPDDRRGRN